MKIVVCKECLLLFVCVRVCVCVTKGGPASVFTLSSVFSVCLMTAAESLKGALDPGYYRLLLQLNGNMHTV